MGSNRSSSKRKSSKRKSSKISSQARKKRIRTKSKKLRHRDDSSSYSDDYSRSPVSISSSSSEDEYSRARSRTRGELKGSKKRSRRSSSRGSREDSRHVKKRKGSKRSGGSVKRKKSEKKKRRREPSVCSVSSDSRSCSDCRESEFERPRGRSREKSKDKRDLGKAKSGTKKNKDRSNSRSSCSRYSDNSGLNDKDVLLVENNSRRLRSVITVPKSLEDEEKECVKDSHKEEIIYDHDDYPSCRSNDSNDGGSKRELVHHSHVDFERRLENVEGEGALVSEVRMTELTKSDDEVGDQDYQSNRADGTGANNSSKENKSEIFPTLSSSNVDDMESILRLKALENLRKYRGWRQTNAKPPADEKNKSESDMKQLSAHEVEFVQNRLPKEDGSGVVGATRVLDQNPRPRMGREPSRPATSYGKVQERKGSSVVCPRNLVAISGNSREEDLPLAGTVTDKSDLGKSAPRKEASGTYSVLKQTHKANMLVTVSNANNSVVKTTEIVGQTGTNDGVGVNNANESSTSEPPSSLKPTLEEQSSKEQQGTDKEGSQYEEKTMSVMRGGEMVQVSYKVYIPKKTPALARRQLRR